MFDPVSGKTDLWRLRGTALQLASYVTAGFLGTVILVAAIDRVSNGGWDSPLLQAWTLVPQVLAAIGLMYVGKVTARRAFWILGLLVALILVEEAFHILNPVEVSMRGLVGWVSERVEVDRVVIKGFFIYGLVAFVGLSFLAVSVWHGSRSERKVILNLALLLAVGGFFGGPVAVLSQAGDRHPLMLVEEVGEAVVFAVMTGYVSGLVYLVAGHRIRWVKDFG